MAISINALLGLPEPRRRRNRKSPGLPGKQTQRVGRNALPTIGLRAAGEVRFSPALRQRLRRRATGLARRQARPQIRAAQQTIQLLESQRARALQSNVGAVNAARDFAQGAAGEASSRAAREAIQSQALNIAGALPNIQRQTRQGFQGSFEEAVLNLTNARADRGIARSEILEQLKNEARATGLDTRGGLTPTQRREGVEGRRTADFVVQNQLAQLKKPPKTEADWAFFTDQVAKSEGVSPLEARRAVEEFRRRNQGTELAQLAEQLGFTSAAGGAQSAAGDILRGVRRLR